MLPIGGRVDNKCFVTVGYTWVDDEDYPLLSRYKWSFDGRKQYVISPKLGILHRVIVNCDPRRDVDHINGNKIDNRKCNLRVCTHAENGRNRTKLNKNNTSGHKNIHWNKEKNRWTVTMNVKNKTYNARGFKNIKDAIKKRDEMLIKYHKAFASFQ